MPTRRFMLSGFGLAFAAGLPGPFGRAARAGEPILTFRTVAGATPVDLAAFDALPQTRFTTATLWQSVPATFSGVRLADFLPAFGAGAAEELRFVALNDYEVEGDVRTLVEGDALLATRRNGKPMPVEDKGPVFLVFPFDDRPELRHQVYYTRAVWQLAEIEAVE